MVWVTAALMAVGLVGIVVPVLPGLLLVWASVGLWAWSGGEGVGWVVFGICSLWYAAGLVAQYLVPGRRMRAAGVQTRTLILAVLGGIVGFFVIPVLGAPVGFVLGILLVEYLRVREPGAAWSSTKVALRAVALSMGIELMAGFAIAATWAIGVWTMR